MKLLPSSSTLPLKSRRSTPIPEDLHDLDHKSDENSQSDLECLYDITDSADSTRNEQYKLDTATFTLPVDNYPFGSPIFEGLVQYMISGVGPSQSGQRINSCPARYTYRGAHTVVFVRSWLPPSNENEKSPGSAQKATNPPVPPGPNADAGQPDPPYPHHLSHISNEINFRYLETSYLYYQWLHRVLCKNDFIKFYTLFPTFNLYYRFHYLGELK